MGSSFVRRRRDEIVRLLEQNGSMGVAELSELFKISPLTVRRDLDALASQGMVRRSYGTVELAERPEHDSSYERERAKRAIAARAAQLIDDGDIVFINTGTTALGALEFVLAENVTFVTNNGRALSSSFPPSSTMILTGGEIRVPKWSMTGDFALANIGQIKAGKCFLSCSGLSAQRGLTTNIAQEMRINELMLENSAFHVVLADSSKIGVDASFSYGSADQIDVLVTDSLMSDEHARLLEQAGVRAILRVDV